MISHPFSFDEPDASGESEAGVDADQSSDLTAKQEQAILALLSEPTIVKAAEQTKVNERTLRRWIDDPGFMRAFRKARRESFGHAISLMQHYAPHAVHALAKVISDPTTPHSARVSAAVAMLRCGREGIELDDLVGRLEALERVTDHVGPRSRWN